MEPEAPVVHEIRAAGQRPAQALAAIDWRDPELPIWSQLLTLLTTLVALGLFA